MWGRVVCFKNSIEALFNLVREFDFVRLNIIIVHKETIAPFWEVLQTYDRKKSIDQLFGVISQYLPISSINSRKKAFSIGCRQGREVFQLERLGFEVDACDIDQKQIEEGKNKGYISSKTRVLIGDYRHYLYEGGVYDLIVALHIPTGFPSVREFSSICFPSLGEGGSLMIGVGRERRREFESFLQSDLSYLDASKVRVIPEISFFDWGVMIIER